MSKGSGRGARRTAAFHIIMWNNERKLKQLLGFDSPHPHSVFHTSLFTLLQ
jgi:hypothetical protein